MSTCIFCKIIAREIPASLVYEDEKVIAFRDIAPKAPHHLLIVPRQHIPTLNDITSDDYLLMGHILGVAKQLAADANVAENGYRLVLNCNADAGQTVFHLHFHLLAGSPSLPWSAG